MFKKVMLAAVATIVITGGALGASVGAASAQGITVHVGDGPGYPDHRDFRDHHRRDRFCKPIFRTVKVWHHGRSEWTRVKVGERCGPHYNHRGW